MAVVALRISASASAASPGAVLTPTPRAAALPRRRSGSLRERRKQRLGDCITADLSAISDAQHQELAAADMRDGLARSDRTSKPASNLADRQVAGVEAMTVAHVV